MSRSHWRRAAVAYFDKPRPEQRWLRMANTSDKIQLDFRPIRLKPDVTRIETAEKRIRGGRELEAPEPEPWILLVEANDAEVVDALARGALSPDRLAAQGAEPGAVSGVYRLQFGLDASG